MPILPPHAARFHERRISSMTFTSAHHYGNVYMWVGVARTLADSSDFGLLKKQNSQKMGDSLPGTPMNRRTKFDAVTVQTNKHTNSNRYISTSCLSARVDKNHTGLSRTNAQLRKVMNMQRGAFRPHWRTALQGFVVVFIHVVAGSCSCCWNLILAGQCSIDHCDSRQLVKRLIYSAAPGECDQYSCARPTDQATLVSIIFPNTASDCPQSSLIGLHSITPRV